MLRHHLKMNGINPGGENLLFILIWPRTEMKPIRQIRLLFPLGNCTFVPQSAVIFNTLALGWITWGNSFVTFILWENVEIPSCQSEALYRSVTQDKLLQWAAAMHGNIYFVLKIHSFIFQPKAVRSWLILKSFSLFSFEAFRKVSSGHWRFLFKFTAQENLKRMQINAKNSTTDVQWNIRTEYWSEWFNHQN